MDFVQFELVGIYGLIAVVVIDKVRQKQWVRMMPFFKHQTAESIEKKLFGFDKAINPKFFTDEAGTITNVNTAAEHLLLWKEPDIVGKNINIIFPKAEHKNWHETFLKWKGEKMELRTFLSTVVNKSFVEIPVEVFMRKEPLDDNNFYLIILRDRTHEVQTIKMYEQVIYKYKMKLDILTKGEELGNNGSWIWDLEDNMITGSDGYKRIIGVSMSSPNKFDANELRGRVLKSYDTVVEGALRRAFSGQKYDITYEQKRPSDFKIITVRSIVEPILNEAGTPIVFYGNTTKLAERDITE